MDKNHKFRRGVSVGLLWSLYLALSYTLFFIAPIVLRGRLRRGKEDPARMAEKLGIASAPRPEGRLIWLHAVGVGEVLALPALIAALSKILDKQAIPFHFLITTSALTSAQAWQNNPVKNTTHQFLPLDFHRFNRRFLNHWQPDIAIWAERDVWPGMSHALARRGIPQVIVNGRMDAASYRAKSAWRGLFGAVYRVFDWIDVQDELSLQHFASLGVERGNLHCSGSLKTSGPALADLPAQRAEWLAHLGKTRLWLGASTHKGEEAVVLSAQVGVENRALLLAPRTPHRAEEVYYIATGLGLSACLIKDGLPPAEPYDVYIETQIGQMGLWYRLADFAFVGGSLCAVGGHNPYEPARLDCAIMHGAEVSNFAEDYRVFDAKGAAVLVSDSADIARVLTGGLGGELAGFDREALVKNAQILAQSGEASLACVAERVVLTIND